MKYVKGNLLEEFANGNIDVMVHGCNCFHTMGAGIAKQIKQAYPAAYAADLNTPKGAPKKLGHYSAAKIGHNKYIINAYTQYRYGQGNEANMKAIAKVMASVRIDFGMLRVGIPKIGAGLAGGDWYEIESIIDSIGFPNIVCVVL